MHLPALIVAMAVGLVLLPASQALAWGPGMHLAAGNHVLSQLHLLAPFVAEVLSGHPRAFLYGCLSADIFIGKGSTFRPGHSHNWETAFRLLESVTQPRLMSYAYGYLTHLAADTVAHNHYIPGLLAVAPSAGTTTHVYFEMQADQRVHWDRAEAQRLLRRPDVCADGLLLAATSHRRLPFLLKKRLMLGGLNLFGRKQWNGSLNMAERILPSLNYESFLQRMTGLTMAAVTDSLNNPLASPVVRLDPIGQEALSKVRLLRSFEGRQCVRDLGRHFPVSDDLGRLPRPSGMSVPLRPDTPLRRAS